MTGISTSNTTSWTQVVGGDRFTTVRVPPRRDDYAWDASPGWVLPAWVDLFKVVA